MNIVEADRLLAQGISAHQAGLLDLAETVYRRVLAEQPGQLTALHLLGLAAMQQGRLDEAGTLLQQVLTLAPATADAWAHLATLHQLRGDVASEAAALDHLLTLQPHQAQAWGRRGVIAFQAGEYVEACAHLARAAELAPDSADVWTNLGAAQILLGRLEEAEASQRRAATIDPTSPMVLNNLGNVLVARASWAEAATVLEPLVQRAPDDVNAWANFGHALRGLGRYEDALAAYTHALAVQPEMPVALDGIGFALQMLDRQHQAIPYHERAVALQPDNADFHEHLGIAYQALGRLDAAENAFRRCLAVAPDLARVHSALIFVLDLKQDAEAEAREERRRWNARFGRHVSAVRRPHENNPDPDRPLRVGYVSADFRHHSAASIVLPILRNHDRTLVSVVCYSGVTRPDHITAEIRGIADRWHDVANLADDDLAALIRADQIDILVDLSGHSGGNRLPVFVQKPAPVQVTAWGYVTGTGLEAMDYLLADPITVPPEERASYAEQIVNLPCVACYESPVNTPVVAPPPAGAHGYVTFGAFNRLPKITARVLETWARVLVAVPASRLIIKSAGADLSPRREQVLATFADHGVHADRLTLLGGTTQPEHLAAHGEIDLMLDTFPHNGGVTTLDALLMGVPVVTLLGPRVAGRLSASFQTTLGLGDLIARTTDEYVEIAARLASDLDRLAHERATLRERLLSSPLGDAAQYTRAVEAAYREIWRRWCAGHGGRGAGRGIDGQTRKVHVRPGVVARARVGAAR